MTHELTSADVQLQELQNMRLLVDVGDGRTIVIPLLGHLALHNFGSPPQAANSAMVGEQGTAMVESQNYNYNMRGWIMTVATLFVGISFQAVSQRPSWMPDPDDGFNLSFGRHGGNSTDPVQREAKRVIGYVLLNTIYFTISLVVVVVLLLPNIASVKHTMRMARLLMTVVAFFFPLNFCFMLSKSARIMNLALIIVAVYSLLTVTVAVSITSLTATAMKKLATYVSRLRSRHRSPPGV